MATVMVKTGIIYKATNKITGKSYIGQTTKPLDERIIQHFKASFNTKNKRGYNSKFYRALRKYNKEDWSWSIIHEIVLEDNINKHEIETIKKFNTFKNGYNSTLGGEDNPMNYESFRKKVSKSKAGKKRPDLSKRNKENPLYGENNPAAKLNFEKVKQIRENYYTKNITIIELSKDFNISISVVSQILNNKTWKDQNFIPTKRKDG